MNAQLGKVSAGYLGDDIPLVTVTYEGVDNPLDLGNFNDYYIVSALFKTAYLSCHPSSDLGLLTVDGVV